MVGESTSPRTGSKDGGGPSVEKPRPSPVRRWLVVRGGAGPRAAQRRPFGAVLSPGGCVPGGRVRARSLASEDRKEGGAAAARAPVTRAAQAARIAGSRSVAGTGSWLWVWNRARRTRPRWTRCCRGRTRCSPFRWAWWRRSPSAASSPPPSKTGASRCGCTSRGSCCECGRGLAGGAGHVESAGPRWGRRAGRRGSLVLGDLPPPGQTSGCTAWAFPASLRTPTPPLQIPGLALKF